MIFRNFVFILLTAFLVSCGGGSDSPSNQSTNGDGSGDGGGLGSPKNQSADGVWIGSVTQSNGTSSEVIAMSSGGEFIIVDIASDVVLSGSLDISGDKLSAAKINQYEYDGSYIMYYEVDGVVNTKSKIIADVIDVESGNKSSLNLDYEILSDEPINYSDLSGSWYFQGDDDIYRREDIDDIGAFTIEDDGCIISGKFSILNNEQIIVKTEFTVSGETKCLIGSYSGLGILLDEDELIAVGVNNQYAISQSFLKIDE
jgi:hypothetical protein